MTGSLHHEVAGAGGGARAVLVHGFTQSMRCWAGLDASLVAAGHEVVRVDAPGHGGSASVRAGFVDAASLVTSVGGRAGYVGYSMGGRLVLQAALSRPELVERLVLIGATPGIEDAGERAERRARDDELAAHVVEVGVDAFIDEWVAQPMFAGLPVDSDCDAARRANTAEGLAASLRGCGTGAQPSLWGRLAELACPVLLITGERDEKFTEIASRMRGLVPSAHHVVIEGAGHAAHLERPDAVAREVVRFLAG